MEVKDIRILREFYKSNIKDTTDKNRRPHFAGREMIVDGEAICGFFEMFNGQGDIENKLTTILGMAGDSQAIYEFMQNAVDANGKYFLLSLYRHDGKPYLVVLNDGSYFRLRDLISILAIGDSTKFRNPDSIGQFGVGFKLAHRLIGKENSIHELLDENKGPLLFSWANEEFADLAQTDSVTVTDPKCVGKKANATSESTAPWLLKIVATNFPCLIEDEVWDARGNLSKGLFSLEEFDALKGAARQCYEELEDSKRFQSGTLLLIPLYEEKIDTVIGNVPKGLEVAATIIARRAGKPHVLTTIIKNERLDPAQLEVERWVLPEEETKGQLGNEIKEAELMLLYSDPFSGNPFEGKPQFYRYFPMAEEQHGFRFAIHSNALDFASSRTALHKSDLNKFLFKNLVRLIDEKLQEYVSEDSEKFYTLYASLLLSERSAGSGNWKEGREWLEESLWQPLMSTLTSRIPIKEKAGELRLDDPIYIKASSLPVEKWYQKGNVNWFYWDTSDAAHVALCNAAASKLHLERISLSDVLGDENTTAVINEWLAEAPENAHLFLAELNGSDLPKEQRSKIWEQFATLKLWWFGDVVYSVKELSEKAELAFHLINYGPLDQVQEELRKAEIYVSIQALDRYPNIERSIRETQQSSLPYLFDYKKLNTLLSTAFVRTESLSPQDKKAIFGAIERAVRDSAATVQKRVETMCVLAIFQNRNRAVLPLEQLIGTENVPEMLQRWRISEGETVGLNLQEYVSIGREEIYEQVTIPNWKEIATQDFSVEERVILYQYLADSFKRKATMPHPNAEYIFYGQEGARDNFFYHPSLEMLEEKPYQLLSQAMSALGIGHLPHRKLLPFYKAAPFALSPASALSVEFGKEHHLSSEALKVFVKWAADHFAAEVENWLYLSSEGKYNIQKRPENVWHFRTENASQIAEYASTYHPQNLLALPDFLGPILQDKVMGNTKLLNYFIQHLEQHIESKEILTSLVLKYGTEYLKICLLERMKPIDLNERIEKTSPDFQVLRLGFSIQDEAQRRQILTYLVGLMVEDKWVQLADLTHRGSDQLEMKHGTSGEVAFSVSELLGEENSVNHVLTEAITHWTTLGLATKPVIEDTLSVHKAPDAEDVWKQMQTRLEDGKLQNGQQYFFALLMAEKGSSAPNLQVETLKGWQPFGSIYFLEAEPFLPKERVLQEKYGEPISVFLGKNQDFKVGQVGFLKKPFLKGSDFQMPGVGSVPADIQPTFGKVLYNSWKEEGPQSLTLNGSADWKAFLGCAPQDWILDADYALPEECVPTEKLISYGIPETDVPDFLKALGAQGDESPSVATRRYFLTGEGRTEVLRSTQEIKRLFQWLYEKQPEVQVADLHPYYKILADQQEQAEFFHGYIPHQSGMRIIPVSKGGPSYVGTELRDKIKDKRLSFNRVADIADKNIIVHIGAIDAFQNQLSLLNKLSYKSKHFDEKTAGQEAIEWDTPYYQKWKTQHRHFRVLLLHREMPHQFLVNGNVLHSFRDGECAISQDTNIVYVRGDYSSVSILNLLDTKSVFTPSARQELRAAFNAHHQEVESLLEIAKDNPVFMEKMKAHIAEIEAEQQKKIATLALNQTDERYKLSWFQNLLSLVREQERILPTQGVRFRKCYKLPEGSNVFELSEYEGRIPAGIGSFENITAIIHYKDTEGNVKECQTFVEADQKHQKVLVHFPEQKAQNALQNQVLFIKLTFTNSVNLIDELKHGFERLNMQPENNLKESLSPNIDFLFGPPGTGKTTTLAKRILEDVEAGIQGPTVILTPTNKAADVLTKKILELAKQKTAPDWLIRAGTCTDPSILDAGAVKPINDITISGNSNSVLITTIHRFCYFKVFISGEDKARLSDCPWRKVIFDEASMIPLAYVVHAIQARQRANSNTQFLVAGDPLQIPPVFDLDLGEMDEDADVMEDHSAHNIYSMIGLRSFDADVQRSIPKYGERIENLTTQHRSIPAIGELFSQFQYGGKIKHSRGTAENSKPAHSRALPDAFSAFKFKPITIVRYPVRKGDTIYNPQKLQKSPVHVYTSLLVSELIKKFRSAAKQQEQKWTLGVLSPYRSQADLLQKMIEGHREKYPDVIISTDTVHGFQGDENAIVFAVLNPSIGGNISYSRFLKKEFILNVAISRAEDYLVLFIPDEDSNGIDNLELLNQLMSITKGLSEESFTFLNALELEKALMGKSRYFEINSFSTAHQKVNVYGVPLMPYTIRINSDSLDVHWSEV